MGAGREVRLLLPERLGGCDTPALVLEHSISAGRLQVLEKDSPGWQKTYISRGQKRIYNGKFSKANVLRKRRSGRKVRKKPVSSSVRLRGSGRPSDEA